MQNEELELYHSQVKIDLRMLREISIPENQLIERSFRDIAKNFCKELPLDKLIKLFGIEVIDPRCMETGNDNTKWKEIWDIEDENIRRDLIEQYERLRFENRLLIKTKIKV